VDVKSLIMWHVTLLSGYKSHSISWL
jgi:hypothetical protein